jgi:hypothetical protein
VTNRIVGGRESKFLWLRCNDPIFYCGKEMADPRLANTYFTRPSEGCFLFFTFTQSTPARSPLRQIS